MMILIGSKAPGRNIEQHDFFFGIGHSLKELIPAIENFWPEAGKSIHIDGWREITQVDGHQIEVIPKTEPLLPSGKNLYFINLGGYQSGKLEEQHYTVLGVYDDRAQAIQQAKQTVFFRTNKIKGASSHIDEKYGIDVDDVEKIEDILAPEFKNLYQIKISPSGTTEEDALNLGYFKLDKIKAS